MAPVNPTTATPFQIAREQALVELREASDWKLLRMTRSGESDAFAELVTRYETRLVAYAARYLSVPDMARDVCQEVFLKLITKPPLVRISNSLAPWLFRVTRNLAIDKRRNARFELCQTDIDTPEPAADSDPRQLAGSAADAEFLRELVAELPPEIRDVVNLRMYGEVPFKDIARILDIPQGTALWRMHRAVELLRQQWRRHEYPV
jgi:RNA polymerase sigma-70 factor (ECF subfamily)